MEQVKIDRINFLAKKSRDQELTQDEKVEQASLRREYIDAIRGSLTQTLGNSYILDKDGKEVKVEKKGNH